MRWNSSVTEENMMKQTKPVNTIKALKYSVLNRDYLFVCSLIIFLISLLVVNTASASNLMQKNNFFQEVGYSVKLQDAYYAQAKLAYNSQDYIYSARLLIVAAALGHNKAKYLLASQYDMGLGVDIDKEQAFALYKAVAKSGLHTAAQHNLAISYAKGHGTQVNLEKAIYWWESAAKRGSTDAQYNLGIVYASGHGGIKPNLKKALKWWRMAAMNGDAVAQFNLGALYANGIGLSSRTCEASRWWKKSAANGFAQAKVALLLLETNYDYDICR